MFVLSRAPCITVVNRWSPLLIRRSGSFVPTLTGAPSSIPDLEASAVLDQAGSENFPVASVLLPRRVRSHLLAVYGFARLADDIGDEVDGDRLAQLDWLTDELDRAARGEATHPLLVRLTPTIQRFALP